ncbi:MAG TPA: hypothetical protein VGF97_17155 [Rhizomicrobium sp.]|jgi:hypothetical protein
MAGGVAGTAAAIGAAGTGEATGAGDAATVEAGAVGAVADVSWATATVVINAETAMANEAPRTKKNEPMMPSKTEPVSGRILSGRIPLAFVTFA